MNTETSPSDSTELSTQTYLPALRPLFFPPPFSPSHPIFVHLSSIANQESQNLRAAAERRIADFVKVETAAIEQREQRLKHQVEVLWTMYRDHLNKLQEEPGPNVARSLVSHSGSFSPGGLGTIMNNPSSVTIRNFSPVPVSPPSSPQSSVTRTSALSVSMATSTFHHLNTIKVRSRLPAYSSGFYGSASSHTPSTRAKSPVPGSNILQFRRNVDDAVNAQASYKYFVNLEEDMARYKHSQEVAMKEQQEAEAGKRAQQAPCQGDSSGVNTNGNSKYKSAQETTPQTPTEDGSAKHEETTSPRGRDKAKRKVTFDVEPVVMTRKIENDGGLEEVVTTEQDSGGKPIIGDYLNCANLDVSQEWSLHLRTWGVKETQRIPQIFNMVLFPFLNKLCLVHFGQGRCAHRTISKPFHPFGLPRCLTLHISDLCEVNLMLILPT
jgi:hypothetical protein